MIKYFYTLIKFIFVVYLTLVLRNDTNAMLIMTISSPILLAAANGIFIFTKNTTQKNKTTLIVFALLYMAIIILSLIINMYIIFANLAIIAAETITTKKLNLNSDKRTSKAVILSITTQLVLVAISFSMYHTFLSKWIYAIFAAVVPVSSLILFLAASRQVSLAVPSFALRNKAKKIVSLVLAAAWAVPFMYCYSFADNGITMRFDFMIYGLLLAIFPYAEMLLALHKKTTEDI